MKTLVANGCEVTVLANLSSGHRTNLVPLPQVRFVEADIRVPDPVDYAIQDATVVFHLAASLGNKRSINDPISDAETIVLGTLRIVSGAFNFGNGSRTSINRLIMLLRAASGIEPIVLYGPPRPGDVRDRLADIDAATAALRFAPAVRIEDGLAEYTRWAKEQVQHV